MKEKRILEVFGQISDQYIEEADIGQMTKPDRQRLRRAIYIATAVAAVVVIMILLIPGGKNANVYAIATPEYPKMSPYSTWYRQGRIKWRQSRNVQLDQPEGYADGLEVFYAKTMKEFLSGEPEQNRVYSPLNAYLALGMLAELTDGESRRQIMELLGVQSVEELRMRASALWNANYCDDGMITSVLSSSLWLDESIGFKKNSVDTLAEVYYVSSHRGKMAELEQALPIWLNEQTHGLLKQQTSSWEMSPDTLLYVVSTAYFKGNWASEFNKNNTATDIFHAPGGDQRCDFMHQKSDGNYWWGKHFSAVYKGFETGRGMWFILPDEDVKAEELLSDEEVLAFLFEGEQWENQKYLKVNLAIPRFDVCSDMDLATGLKELGVTDVFDRTLSDFSPLTDMELFVDNITQAVRVKADEAGVEAASYTRIGLKGATAPMPPDDEVDFILDRPFLFVIEGMDGAPLFVGIVNNPNA